MDNLEYEILKEIGYYNTLPCTFNGFIDIPSLSDDKIHLVCTGKNDANLQKLWISVPNYDFAIYNAGEKIGEVNLRIGYNDFLYYSGQISYMIDERYRGNGYAVRACRLIEPVARAHELSKLLIAVAPNNAASIRVCEKLKARFVRVAPLPEWHDRYGADGLYHRNIYAYDIR